MDVKIEFEDTTLRAKLLNDTDILLNISSTLRAIGMSRANARSASLRKYAKKYMETYIKWDVLLAELYRKSISKYNKSRYRFTYKIICLYKQISKSLGIPYKYENLKINTGY